MHHPTPDIESNDVTYERERARLVRLHRSGLMESTEYDRQHAVAKERRERQRATLRAFMASAQ